MRRIADNVLFYYDDIDKLWIQIDNSQLHCFVYSFFDNTSTEIKVLLKNSKDEVDKYMLKQFEALFKLFDKETFINEIIRRSISYLNDIQFITILDSKPDFLAINNGKKLT